MIKDQYGQLILSEHDICDLLMRDPEINLDNALVNFTPIVQPLVEYPKLHEYLNFNGSLEDFDVIKQSIWYMPDEYKNMDIALWVLNKCETEAELQRAGEELFLYQEMNLFMLLRYLKYLVDTMRKHNIVWGVGRGSSTASYVLFLIGIHKINSLYYDLPIEEFLKT